MAADLQGDPIGGEMNAPIGGYELAMTVATAMVDQWGWSEEQAGNAAAFVVAKWLDTCSDPDGD